ncbi:ribosome biogenesis factor YjgA [Hydrocarboniphaga sp.]|uniref:ribosome biogenesis factor YjgA n=1 Tax=Hydrocarboniphaga sp. TaxID=2033016 RepID=UPI00260A2878|nr:ribosome biogenesis factor YjgA [Hydrocarboniphaga sp.]
MKKGSDWRPDLRDSHEDADEDLGPSKTQVKQAMHELQDLGVALLELPPSQLAALQMEDRLRNALVELQRLTSREAIRRQSQFIGKMLRDADSESFRAAIHAYRHGQNKLLQEAELWRTRLLADDAAVTEWVEIVPEANLQQLRSLIRNVRREQTRLQQSNPDAEAAPPKGRLYRELFQKLRIALQQKFDQQAAG